MAFVAMQRFGMEVSANIGKHTVVTASHHSSLPHKAPDVSNAGRFVMINIVVANIKVLSYNPGLAITTHFFLGVSCAAILVAFAIYRPYTFALSCWVYGRYDCAPPQGI